MRHSNLLYQDFAQGKLMLTGEYLALRGATSLALPLKFGQSLEVYSDLAMSWEARDYDDTVFYTWQMTANLHLEDKLQQCFRYIADLGKMNEDSFNQRKFITKLTFNKHWGLGSSSTLVCLLAKYFDVNPYALNAHVFQGSSYDIACGYAKSPILYTRIDESNAKVVELNLPQWTDFIYFVYSGQKQSSIQSIRSNRENIQQTSESLIFEISEISKSITQTKQVSEVIDLFEYHDTLISSVLGHKPLSHDLGHKMPFYSKYLGAWHGDFFMILSDLPREDIHQIIGKSEYPIFFAYHEIVQSKPL
ncbi:MAG: hypothetical protein MUE53_01480 [Chitinophagales bacterium]|nr:hypothetical protein [Chitinophagales bacterium]